MSCRRVEGLMSDYQDGLLGPAARRIVEDHLASCASCAALKSEMDSGAWLPAASAGGGCSG